MRKGLSILFGQPLTVPIKMSKPASTASSAVFSQFPQFNLSTDTLPLFINAEVVDEDI
jgi:hypothetical protein